jgi:WD40 repeat protein
MPLLNLEKLKDVPRLCMAVESSDFCMTASNNCLLYCSHKQLTLIDANGQELFIVKRNFSVLDICWSSYLDQFLILSTENTLHSLDVRTEKLVRTTKFSRNNIRSCTCYSETLMVSNYDHKSFIDVYDLRSDYKLIESYELPVLGRKNQYIEMIRLNETYLGVMLNQHDIQRNWFELRRPDDMSVLYSTDLVYNDYVHHVVALPKNEFLIHVHEGKEILVLVKNGAFKPPIKPYIAEKGMVSTAFINDKKCLVIQTNEPRELHFYDL